MSDQTRENEKRETEDEKREMSASPSGMGVRPSTYRVQLDLFEGPLDLLLHLIKKSEVDVTDIPVAAITEQYLSYLDVLRELNLDIAGEYLVMAATLTLIKSRMLLPAPEGDDEEEPDPRADLIRRLLEYQRFRDAAAQLAEQPFLNRDVFSRDPSEEATARDDGAVAIRATTWELLDALRAVLLRARPGAVHEVEAEPVALRDCVDTLLRTLSVAKSVTFDSLFDERSSRPRIIVTFLALLELMKLGALEAVQHEQMGPIMIVLAIDDVSSVSLDLADDYGGQATAASEEGVHE